MLYPLFRPLLFKLDPETAHEIAFAALDAATVMRITPLVAPKTAVSPVSVMGISFPNRLGVAAGLDKNGSHIDGLATLGFGFIECGTVTPRAQPGNPKPRMFRLPEVEALINRLGFNNAGVPQLVANITRAHFGPKSGGILGINIGKNFDTPNDRAIDDYLACLRAVHTHASYVAVNISSPNTQRLRELQEEGALERLLGVLKTEQATLADAHGKYTPLAVKIAPDLTSVAIERMAKTLIAQKIDAVIATNTTIDRAAVAGQPSADEKGGLSGRPLHETSTQVIRSLAEALDGAVPIIGVGGIMSGADAKDKIDAGATLVQIYTGLIYRGPELVVEIANALAE